MKFESGVHRVQRVPDTETRKGERPVWLSNEQGFAPVPVFDRYALPSGWSVEGPAIIEERESTLVLPRRARCVVARDSSLVVEMRA